MICVEGNGLSLFGFVNHKTARTLLIVYVLFAIPPKKYLRIVIQIVCLSQKIVRRLYVARGLHAFCSMAGFDHQYRGRGCFYCGKFFVSRGRSPHCCRGEKTPIIVVTITGSDSEKNSPPLATSTFATGFYITPTRTKIDPTAPTSTPTPTATAKMTKTLVRAVPSTLKVTRTPKNTATHKPTATDRPTRTPTNTATLTPTGTATATPTNTLSPTPTPGLPGHIVISKFRTRGQNGASDEFVEIFNPSGDTVDIGGWLIKKSSGCGTSMTILLIVPTGTHLLPGQHFLAAPSDSSISNPDQNFTGGIADNGGIAIFDNQGGVVDRVGMCVSTLYFEGNPLSPVTSTFDRSYERSPGSTFGSCYDTNNNLIDFTLVTPSAPKSMFSPLTVCMGAVPAAPTKSPTATPTFTPTTTATFTPTSSATTTPISSSTANDWGTASLTGTTTFIVTPTPTLPVHIIISEFRTRGQNGAGDEFIEIFNSSSSGDAVDIGGWLIKKSSGCGTSLTTMLTISDGIQLLPGQHFLAAPVGVSASNPDQNFTAGIADNGGIAIFNGQGIAVDEVGMCSSTSYLEGDSLPSITSSLDHSYERLPGGTSGSCYDTGNNFNDFTLIALSEPQNLSSPLTICASAATPTDTATLTNPPTLTPTSATIPTPTSAVTDTATAIMTGTPTFTFTPTPTLPDHILISEFRTRGPSGVGDEFIEIFNPSDETVDIGGWLIKKSSGCGISAATLLTITADVQLPPGQYFLAAPLGASVSDPDQNFSAGIADNGGIAIFDNQGTVIDRVGMCATTLYLEGSPLSPMASNVDESYERSDDTSDSYDDTDDNFADFSLITPSDPQNNSDP
jgi:hypothetical protein